MNRSENMSRIRSRDTKAEVTLRQLLFRKGLRYRCHVKSLAGKPDIVFAGPKVVVFVHGCFWHQHPGCREASNPRTNTDYWMPKLARNVARDREHTASLQNAGYEVVTVWECDIERDAEAAASEIEQIVRSRP